MQRPSIICYATIGVVFSLGVFGAEVATSSDFVPFSQDVGFIATPIDEWPMGLHFGAEVGPTGGPYRSSDFFLGVQSTTAGGLWAQPDSVFGLCFNLDRCSGQRILSDTHAFGWTWEATYQGSSSSPTMIENNVGVTYSDGTSHRPWAFDILTDVKAAVLNFSSTPERVNFQINQNGNVVIGTPFRQPVKQLEVVGDALFTRDVDINGNLKVAGARVLTAPGSGSSGPLQWGVSDGASFASAGAVCAASQLGCRGAVLPNGTQLACSVSQPQGAIFFALCQ